jgi:integral membrane protein (TIGR01906 family)
MNQTLSRILSWIITLIVPFFLIITAVRLVFTPFSVPIVYRLPGFPPDQYGFSVEDRQHWARVSLNYLLSNADISYLAGQTLPDGQPLYNARELKHMVDVKTLFQTSFRVWDVLLAMLAIGAIWAWRGRWFKAFLHSLGRGGIFTIGLVVLVLVAVAVSFSSLFTVFHEIFFTGDSWLFLYTDSLIRLFPLPLWELAFVVVGVLTLIGSVVLIFLDRRYGRA